MTANKHQEIRSALCWQEDIAEMARLHNNANIIALPARYISEEIALKCVDIFLKTDFEGGRHAVRVEKIKC
jgi:ribose 5-phosphate isomerase B